MTNGGHLRRAKGTGTVRLRADGRYEGRLTVDGVRRGVYAYSQAEVEALLAEMRGTPPTTHRAAAHPARMTTHRATVQALGDARRLGLNTDDTARLVLSSTRPGRVARGIYGPCAYCGDIYASSVDHVIPTSRGGLDEASNLVSACVRCNGVKGNRTPEEWGQPPEGSDRMSEPRRWPSGLEMTAAEAELYDRNTKGVRAAPRPFQGAFERIVEIVNEQPRGNVDKLEEIHAIARECLLGSAPGRVE